MKDYELPVNFTEDALKEIYEKDEKLIISKEVTESKGANVCWVSALPFRENTIKWNEEYMLYASRGEDMNGVTCSDTEV